ncbi:MAG: DUF4145 domain-containing protein, partial [Clostridia bacterium]|nr:DUF4145 domain-containing protein [Clostridia bacterium]
MTNFDFLTEEKDFASFSSVAVAAEKTFHIDLDTCVVNCRRAMEFAVKWMYTVDADLTLPDYDDNLVTLLGTEEFRDIVGAAMLSRMHYIRKLGNVATHSHQKVTEDQARLCLENLFYFMDMVAYFYADDHTAREYDPTLPDKQNETLLDHSVEINIEELIKENEKL